MNAQDSRKLASRFLELPPEKRRIFLQMLAREGVDFAQFPIPAGVAAPERGVPSYAQQRMWFLWQLEPEGAAYNLPGAVRLDGRLDERALEQAFASLAERHETLRTAFRRDAQEQLQQVPATQAVAIEREDLRGLDAQQQHTEVRAQAQRQALRPFDLEQGPLWRVRLLTLGDEQHVLLLTLHHIVSDGWSMNVLIDEFIRSYDALERGQLPQLPALPIQYSDYALWQRCWLEAGEQERQLQYWQAALGEEHPVLELPTDFTRPALPSHRGTRYAFAVDAGLAEQLRGLAQAHQASLFMVLLAAFDSLLHRYSGQHDLRVGVPIANRNREEVEGLIGFFVNTQVLRCQIDSQTRVVDLIARVREAALGAQAHQELPFERLVEALKLERSLSHNPLFQVMYNHQPLVTDITAVKTASGLSLGLIEWEGRTTQFDLSLDTWERGGQLHAALTYADELFSPETIARMARHWLNLLQAMVADPQQRVGQLPMLHADELQRMVHDWNPGGPGFQDDLCIHERIAEQVAAQPDALALTYGRETFSYAQLDAWANRLAQRLAAAGVGPEVRVGVALPRTPQMLVALLAVFKAGGAYVPLDPDYPAERIAYMLADSTARVLLSDAETVARLQVPGSTEVLLVDACADALAAWPAQPLQGCSTPQNLAYVIYTSGSTGLPKGVAITHRNVLALIHWSQQVYRAEDIQGVLASTSICFDLSVWELFVTLAGGGSIILARNALELPQLPARDQVRLINTVPSAIAALQRGGQIPASVRIINLAGEPLKQRLVDALYQQPGLAHVYDLYGPSEDTTYSTWTRRTAGGRANIGRPLPHTASYLLDGELQVVAQGRAAELYLAGAGVTRGYLGRPGLTAEKFLPDPFAGNGERLYRTGDLVRYRDGGEIEYVGRIDHQVKVRGFRIELGEIEARLQAQPAVREVAVLVQDGPSGQQLVAYVVPVDPALASADATRQSTLREQLKAALGEHLPDYMVPAALLFLEQLPLTPNGKLDRKALPAADTLQAQREHVAPVGEGEHALAAIWQSLLGLEQVGVLDNFFELGGDSIVSMQVVSRAREAGLALSPKDIFQFQTIRSLAQVAGRAVAPLEQGPARGELALTPIQHWFFEQAIPERQHWNQSLLLDARVNVDAGLLQQALDLLLEHHDSLRLRFVEHAGTWQQHYADSAGAVLWVRDAATAEQALAHCEEAQRSLDLSDGPLLRVLLLELAEGRQQLLLVLHHLVVDGVSWRVLLEDLQGLYGQLQAQQAPRLPVRTSSYQAWAQRLQQAAGQHQATLDWWAMQLQTAASAELPCSDAQGALENHLEQKIECRFDSETTRQLLQVAPAAYRTQVNDLLLTALARVLCRWTAAPGALIELEGHGREDLFDDLDLSRSIGWFTSLYPLLLIPGDDLGGAIKTVKEQLRAVPANGIGHGLLRYLAGPEATARLAALPKPRVTFNYLGQFDRQFDAQALFVPAGAGGGQAQDPRAPLANWLTVEGQVYGGELALRWGFSRAMFAPASIQALADDFSAELKALIAHCCAQVPGQATASDFPLARLQPGALESLPVDSRELDDLYPLSPMQQGMLFHSLYENSGSDYINQMRVEVDGLEPARLRQAWQAAMQAHDVLRSGFVWQGELQRPLQMVFKQVELPWQVLDWRDRADLEPALAQLAQQEREAGFELTRAPLLRITLVRTDESRYQLIQTSHHLLLDGWSNSRLLGEVLQRYSGRSIEAPVGRYRDYIAWLGQQDLALSEAFWREQLRPLEAPTRLAQAIAGPASAVPGHGDHYQQLDAAFSERLSAFARQQKVTVNTLVQAAWLLLLQRYTGQDCVAFGATVAGRPMQLRGIEQQVGLFINTLPVIASPAFAQTVGDWLQAVQAANLALREHEHTPLFEIQRWSGQGNEALFDTLLVFENYPLSAALAEGEQLGVRFGAVDNLERTNYALTVAVTLGQQLDLHYSFQQAAFRSQSVARLADELKGLLAQFIEGGERVLAELELAAAVAPAAVPQAAPGERVWLHRLIEAQVARTPQAIALKVGDEQLSYAELNARANQLAQVLMAAGVGPEVLVGIALPRGTALIIGLLAILKAGAAYVPLDPEYPAERLAYMVRDSAVALVLTDAHSTAVIGQAAVRTLRVDQLPAAANTAANPEVALTEHSLLCLIYTSGSTGQPKGVALEHGALLTHLQTMQAFYRVSAEDRFLHFASLNFDWGTEQWLMPLISGACCILRGEGLWSADEALQVIAREQASIVYFPTQYACQLAARAATSGQRVQVRSFNVAGEAFPREGFEQIQAVLQPQYIVNGYGPTETVITPFLWEAHGDTRVDSVYAPIGRPVAQRTAYVLADGLSVQPHGVVGELYIGGAALARGYHGRAALTAERFVPDPFAVTPGTRLYRSGDLVRYLDNDELEYIGRVDHQVKIRGFRIEIGEVEACLLALPAVAQAAVVAIPAATGQQLVAYLVPAVALGADDIAARSDLRDSVRAALAERLPDYMLPAHWQLLEHLPLTPNGKLDRKALPAPDASLLQGAHVAPVTALEQQLAGYWCDVLGVAQVGLGDNFFDLGGHSLLATQVISRVRHALDIDVPLRALFEAPDLGRFAEAVQAQATPALAGLPVLQPITTPGRQPLSFAQQRLWFLWQLEPQSSMYNIPRALRLEGELNVEAVRLAFEALLQRHTVLRTTYVEEGGESWQQVHAHLPLAFRFDDLQALAPELREAQLALELEQQASAPFDLVNGPLLRVGLLQLAPQQHQLLVTLHHIVADYWSFGILLREFVALYDAIAQGQASPLPVQALAYQDFAVWQRQWLAAGEMQRQLDYWQQALGDQHSLTRLPGSLAAGAQEGRCEVHEFTFSTGQSEALRNHAKATGLTPYMLLLAGFSLVVAQRADSRRVRLGTDIANRNHAGVEEMVGFFVNQLVLQLEVDEQASVEQLLQACRATVIGASDHQDLPFDRLVEALRLPRQAGRSPLFAIKFIYQEGSLPMQAPQGLQVHNCAAGQAATELDLIAEFVNDAEAITAAFKCDAGLYTATDMQDLFAQLQGVFEQIVAEPQAPLAHLLANAAAIRATAEQARAEARQAQLKAQHPIRRRARGLELQ